MLASNHLDSLLAGIKTAKIKGLIHAVLGMNPYWDVYGHSNGRFYRMTPQGGRIAEMHVANICCVKAQRAGRAVARQRPTALPKLPYGRFSDMPGPWPTRSEAVLYSYKTQAETPG